MKKNIYIDITGLSYKYQSGVQNTLWGLVDAAEDDDIRSKLNIIFYDCSGKYNERVSSNSLLNYVNFIYSNIFFLVLPPPINNNLIFLLSFNRLIDLSNVK